MGNYESFMVAGIPRLSRSLLGNEDDDALPDIPWITEEYSDEIFNRCYPHESASYTYTSREDALSKARYYKDKNFKAALHAFCAALENTNRSHPKFKVEGELGTTLLIGSSPNIKKDGEPSVFASKASAVSACKCDSSRSIELKIAHTQEAGKGSELQLTSEGTKYVEGNEMLLMTTRTQEAEKESELLLKTTHTQPPVGKESEIQLKIAYTSALQPERLSDTQLKTKHTQAPKELSEIPLPSTHLDMSLLPDSMGEYMNDLTPITIFPRLKQPNKGNKGEGYLGSCFMKNKYAYSEVFQRASLDQVFEAEGGEEMNDVPKGGGVRGGGEGRGAGGDGVSSTPSPLYSSLESFNMLSQDSGGFSRQPSTEETSLLKDSSYDTLPSLNGKTLERGGKKKMEGFFDPEIAPICEEIAQLYFSHKKMTEALVWYEYALQLNPLNPIFLYRKGVVYQTNGQLEEAVKCFVDSLEIDPSSTAARFNLGVVKSASQPEEALKHFNQILKDDPENTEVMFMIADIHEKDGRVEQAKSFLDDVIRLDPTNYRARRTLQRLKS